MSNYYTIMNNIKNMTNNDDIYELFSSSKDFLNKDHFIELINRNILIDEKLLNLGIYNIYDYFNDIKLLDDKNDTAGTFGDNYIIKRNHIYNIIKYIKTDEERDIILLFINENIKYYGFQDIMLYIHDKDKQKSYKEWNVKYPRLWKKLLEINNIPIPFKNDIYLNLFRDIDILEYFDIDIEKYRNMLLDNIDKVFTNNSNKFNNGLINKDSINYFLSYTFNSNSLDKFNIIFNAILSNNRYFDCIIYIIKNDIYNNDDINKIVNYYKINNLVLDHVIKPCDYKYLDFIFKYIYNIDKTIQSYKFNNYTNLTMTQNDIDSCKYELIFLQYLIRHIFINNIDYDFDKLNKDSIIFILNDFIKNNEIKSSYVIFYDLLKKCINEYVYLDEILNSCIFKYIHSACNNIIKNIINNNIDHKDINLLKYINKYYNEIKSSNIIKNNLINNIITLINNNEFNKKFYRYLDKYRSEIKKNNYKNLENNLLNYNLKISFISKLNNKSNIGYDVSKLIFDYL